MTLHERLQAFAALGTALQALTPEQIRELAARAGQGNAWFDEANVAKAFNGIEQLLDPENLQDWVYGYQLEEVPSRKVGVVMAGNIPMVGFHDMLSVLLAGHELYAKLSSEDTFLMQYLAGELVRLAPEFGNKIHFVERLKDVDAVIATGSDNTARYFEYYFGKKPHIIRRNRSSLGILTGQETTADLQALGHDIFQFYGLGCRNVSKLFVPKEYDFIPFFEALEPLKNLAQHHKYFNNFDYNKSILLVNKRHHFDNGFLLVTESEQLVSPISVLHYQTYRDAQELQQLVEEVADKTQCLVSAEGWYKNSTAFGQAQCPDVWDYADGVDTLNFLSRI
ncbi:MAG: acyl-CoA reductase [Adhaeribacter sp.]